MSKATTVCFIAFWMFLAFTDAVNGCPPVPCPRIRYPPSCRSVSFFLHGSKVCQGCDMCVKKATYLDNDGCPLRNCLAVEIPKYCRRDIYYVYQGGKICQDCPRNTCKY